MRKRGLGIVGLLAIGAMLVLSGCGGGGGDKRLTKEEFAAKANALCTDFNKANSAAGNPSDVKGAIAYFEKLIPLYKKQVEGFGKLKPPADEETSVNRIITLGNEQATRAEDLVAALKKGDMTKANNLVAEGNTNSKETKTLFTELGATVCAKSED